MNPVKKHPNASVALVSSVGLGTLVVQIAAHFGLHLSTEWGLTIAGALATAALFIGRNGFVGTCQFVKKIVLHGTGGRKS